MSEFLGSMIQLFIFLPVATFFCSHFIVCVCVCVFVCVHTHAHLHLDLMFKLSECLKYWGTWTEDLFRHFALLLQVTTCYQQRIICWINIFAARKYHWFPISFSRGSSQPRDRTRVSNIVGRLFTVWATREAQKMPGESDFLILPSFLLLFYPSFLSSFSFNF